jgi:hypothetical protein
MSSISQPYKGYLIDRTDKGWMIFDPKAEEYITEKEFTFLNEAKRYIDLLVPEAQTKES